MRAKLIPMEEQYKLVLECRQSGLSDYHWCLVSIPGDSEPPFR